MAADSINGIIEAFYNSCNDYQSGNANEMFCSDAVMNCTGVDPLRGEAIENYIGGVMEACPGMRFTIREVTELKATGTASEEALVLWRGEIPDGVAGKEGMVVVDGIDRVQVKDGRISRLDSYFDRVPLAADLLLSTRAKASEANV